MYLLLLLVLDIVEEMERVGLRVLQDHGVTDNIRLGLFLSMNCRCGFIDDHGIQLVIFICIALGFPLKIVSPNFLTLSIFCLHIQSETMDPINCFPQTGARLKLIKTASKENHMIIQITIGVNETPT